MKAFAQPPAQHLAATPGEPPAPAGRPAVRIPLRTDRTSLWPIMANRTQVSKGTALLVTPARFSACEIIHRDPKAQPYCAGCGCWLPAYPFNTTNLCESCSTQPEG